MSAGGFGQVTDNVLRRKAFEQDPKNAGVVITHLDDPWCWMATFYSKGIRHQIVNHELGLLLDILEALGEANEHTALGADEKIFGDCPDTCSGA